MISGSCNRYIGMNFVVCLWFTSGWCVDIRINDQFYWHFSFISPVFLPATKLCTHMHALCTSEHGIDYAKDDSIYGVQTDGEQMCRSVTRRSSREIYCMFMFC